ncbi:putative lumazine-binding protein [Krasilnikovia cinnamomea]|uniref:Putative lumazine-binding protein n=1 Tax=Krasilnikovia cinnamomea TaxID=349313 RepID=A0A4Q7ZSK0_9ACTN|nr:nuclear transport factor 2 family protein [Krasilnikovia cinnamomea]RZU53834.1 putative lumazine-binding protein [Krasilnikovia cinnamomea]
MTGPLTEPDARTREAIESVLQLYFDGLHHSDTTRLARAFHPQATYASATGGTLTHLTLDAYFPIVDARPAPAARAETRRDAVISIQLAGPVTASAVVTCAIGPKRFIDLLTLVRVDDRWQIISKVFHYDLAETEEPAACLT